MKLSHFILSTVFSVGLISCSSETTPELTKRELSIQGRAAYENERLMDPATGKIPENIKMRELAFASTLPKSISGESRASGQEFIPIGPRNIGGRTRAISFHKDMPDVILAGGVSGGMWRSSDFGNSWSRATNYEDQSAVSCMMQDQRPGKSNVFYYGSGESIGNSASKAFSAMYYGSGMYKSIDDGKTWVQLTSTATLTQEQGDWSFIFNIASDPSNLTQDEIYAATSKGIRRSEDGGLTWTLVLGGSGSASWTNIVVSTTGICYAQISNDGVQPGFWRSTDGINWTSISPSDLPANHDRTLMAIAPGNENIVYYYTVNPGYGLSDVSFWKYTYNNGDGSGTAGTWENRTNNLPPTSGYDLNTQGSYCMSLIVDPVNSDMLYLGATNIFRSTNGFNTANATNQLGGYDADGYSNFDWYDDNQHPDQQSLAFNPNNVNQLLASTDGGLHITDDPEANKVIWSSLNNGYQTTQFYGLAIDHLDENEIVCSGYQDNGSWLTETADTLSDWVETTGGDGCYCAKTGGEDNYYFSSQYGTIYKVGVRANGGYSRRYITPQNVTSSFLFNHPFILDPADNNIMYLPNGGDLWRNGNLDGLDNGVDVWESIGSVGSTITALAASKSDPGTVFVGTSGRKIFKIVDDGTSNAVITDVSTDITSGGYTSNIDIDPNDANNILVTFSSYNIISMWSSTDGGTSWSSVEGNLKGDPEVGLPAEFYFIGNGPSFRWAKYINTDVGQAVLLGTSVGLFATSELDGENTVWVQQASDVIGNVVIEQIDYRESDGFCVVGTHGAGAYKTYFENNWDITSIEKIDDKSLNIKLFPNPTVSNVELNFDNSGNENVRVNVLNAAGKVVVVNQIQTVSGTNTLSINLNGLAQGMYYVTLYTTAGNFTKSVMKQ